MIIIINYNKTLSFYFSYISGVTILGTPSEIYRFGTQYCIIAIAIWISGAVVATVYLPVFCKLQLYSSYEVIKPNLFYLDSMLTIFCCSI